jgi:DNA-binding response OmpR family regulator
MPSVLVVDDEANIRELVAVYFTAAGFTVAQAEDGPSGLAAALDADDAPDLVILDINLPGMDGAEVCRRIRERSSVPVIMLTAKHGDLDKVGMLEGGADDYVTKPFSAPELVARARAVLRRTAAQPAPQSSSPEAGAAVGVAAEPSSPVIELGGLRIDPATREVDVDGRPVELTAKEFDLLAAMAAEPGVVFSREKLLERAWGFAEYVDARGIDVHVRHLREKLGDDAAAPRFVETVRSVGYRVRREPSR